jgi:hypothetical protein
MRTVSAALAQHLAGEVTALATCWRIARREGVVQGFTDHVRDLEVEGVIYKAASATRRPRSAARPTLRFDNLDFQNVFSDAGSQLTADPDRRAQDLRPPLTPSL